MNKTVEHEIKRPMSHSEMECYLFNLIEKVKYFNPDEIVGINRGGMSYGTWIAHILDLPLGMYIRKGNRLMLTNESSKRLMLIDDNIISGETFTEVKNYFDTTDYIWKFGVLFSDSIETPEVFKQQIISGTDLNYFATTVPGFYRNFKPYERARDKNESI